MADTKISALTALVGADIATDDEIPIVDTSTTTTKKTTMADLSARTETMTNKTLTAPVIATIVSGGQTMTVPAATDTIVGKATTDTLTNKTIDKAVILGVPVAEGAFGRDTAQLAFNDFNNGMLGVRSRVIEAGVGTQTFINDTTSDQSFTSFYTLPANSLFTDKAFRLTVLFELIRGVSTAALSMYLELGGTRVYSQVAGGDLGNSATSSVCIQFLIVGRAAAGAAAAVSTANLLGNVGGIGTNTWNATNQPVNLATSGTMTVVLGVVYSGTGSTESIELQGWLIEELN